LSCLTSAVACEEGWRYVGVAVASQLNVICNDDHVGAGLNTASATAAGSGAAAAGDATWDQMGELGLYEDTQFLGGGGGGSCPGRAADADDGGELLVREDTQFLGGTPGGGDDGELLIREDTQFLPQGGDATLGIREDTQFLPAGEQRVALCAMPPRPPRRPSAASETAPPPASEPAATAEDQPAASAFAQPAAVMDATLPLQESPREKAAVLEVNAATQVISATE